MKERVDENYKENIETNLIESTVVKTVRNLKERKRFI